MSEAPNLEENAEVPGDYKCDHFSTESQTIVVDGQTVKFRYCRMCGATVE